MRWGKTRQIHFAYGCVRRLRRIVQSFAHPSHVRRIRPVFSILNPLVRAAPATINILLSVILICNLYSTLYTCIYTHSMDTFKQLECLYIEFDTQYLTPLKGWSCLESLSAINSHLFICKSLQTRNERA